MNDFSEVVVLSGGVGGAKLVDGLYAHLGPRLTAVVNTGDDFEHWGLRICPDLDTVMYTLSRLSDDFRGWGLRGETFACRDAVGALGGDVWFNLGDRDLATHLLRTDALHGGQTLTAVTARLNEALGVTATVLPMCDGPRPTMVDLADGRTLPFQRWLVQERAPAVRAVRHEGSDSPTEVVLAALQRCDGVVIAPSNPFVSIAPMLTLRGVREAVANKPVVAVSPIVGGEAVKGPLAAMIPALQGRPASAEAVAAWYGDLVDAWVIERGDAWQGGEVVRQTATVMTDRAARARLAKEVLEVLASLG